VNEIHLYVTFDERISFFFFFEWASIGINYFFFFLIVLIMSVHLGRITRGNGVRGRWRPWTERRWSPRYAGGDHCWTVSEVPKPGRVDLGHRATMGSFRAFQLRRWGLNIKDRKKVQQRLLIPACTYHHRCPALMFI
jgi:hypothetical protein